MTEATDIIDALDIKPQAPGSVLGRIVAQKVEDVAARARARSLEACRMAATKTDRSFFRALIESGRKPALIAEVKRRSPSKGALRPDLAVEEVAAIYERHAAAISVVTDTPFFDGHLDLLSDVRRRVTRPVLLKDFVVSEYQLYEGRAHGADAVLLMASVLVPRALARFLVIARDLGMDALVEVHDEVELAEAREAGAVIIGVNNRDLTTLTIDPDRVLHLAPLIGAGKVIVAESGLTTRADVDRIAKTAHAALIGTAFMEAPDVEARIVELGW